MEICERSFPLTLTFPLPDDVKIMSLSPAASNVMCPFLVMILGLSFKVSKKFSPLSKYLPSSVWSSYIIRTYSTKVNNYQSNQNNRSWTKYMSNGRIHDWEYPQMKCFGRCFVVLVFYLSKNSLSFRLTGVSNFLATTSYPFFNRITYC